jgi:tetratricopeptide (TPR) repeat protein
MKKHFLNIAISISILLAVLLAYQNLYDNEFHFDDSHTIQENPFIKDIHNIPIFFTKGAETFSTLPANQVYRPMVTTSIAVDYWLNTKFSASKNGFDMGMYHYSMMLTFILLLALLFAFFYKILQLANPHTWNHYFAFFATAFFGLHTVNAETINYIISRSDLLSTFFVMAALDIFLYFPAIRKWAIYLIPLVLGLLTKQTTVMIIPIIIVYFYIFEYLPLSKTEKKALIFKYITQAFLLIVLMIAYVIFDSKMQSDAFVPSNHSRWDYLITQPFVLLHYFISFFVPYQLSADTDWTILQSIFSFEFFIGIVFILGMLFLVYKTFKIRPLAPVSFGILFFFLALAPTSSLIPLAEVLNDHRMFYPFVGLTLATISAIAYLIIRFEQEIRSQIKYRLVIFGLALMILGGHFYGVRQRTEVWDNGKTLWYDVTIKSPKNGRGLMNYGLRLMSDGDLVGAMNYFNKALVFSPQYTYLHTNMGICFYSMGDKVAAENSFKLALQYGYYSHKTHYYYGDFLYKNKRYDEAIASFNTSLELAPNYLYSLYKLMDIYAEQEDWDNLKRILEKTKILFPNDQVVIYYTNVAQGKLSKLAAARNLAKKNPSADAFLDLSVQYYYSKKYDSCVVASQQVLSFDAKNISAYNNICAASNILEKWEQAIAAGQNALKLDPNNQLAKNNLALSFRRLDLQKKLTTLSKSVDLINLSLAFYQEQMYDDCIVACEKALKDKANDPFAYNNICSAYNALGQYQKAIQAGELALKYDPKFERAANNVAHAKKMMAQNQ